jgi:hypothetical protein
MKKLMLFILVVMLTFSIGTVKVSASSEVINPGTKITNLLGDDGGFNIDTDNNGLADNWLYADSSNGVLVDNQQYVYSSGLNTYFGLNYQLLSFEANHTYYLSFEFDTNVTNPKLDIIIPYPDADIVASRITDTTGEVRNTFTLGSSNSNNGFRAYMSDNVSTTLSSSNYFSIQKLVIIDLTQIYGTGNEPFSSEFEETLKIDYFSGTVSADEIIDFSNNTRVSHYLYDVPNIFTDFPSAVTMENLIRVAFFIPLMIIFYLLIPLFNFLLSGSATGSILLGLLILAFILREVIRFIDPDFHLYGKNSYYDGYNRSKTKE